MQTPGGDPLRRVVEGVSGESSIVHEENHRTLLQPYSSIGNSGSRAVHDPFLMENAKNTLNSETSTTKYHLGKAVTPNH